MRSPRRSSAALSRRIGSWDQECRWFIRVSDWIVGTRVDLIVADAVVVELKTVDRLTPVHDAQLLTYLRLGGSKVGLLINFNVGLLCNGIHRRVLGLEE